MAETERKDPPSGIRARVWLAALALLLLCVFAISLSRRQTARSAEEPASGSGDIAHRDGSPGPQASARWKARKPFASEVHESEVSLPGILSAEEARSLALRMANEKARELYDCEPFGDGPPASLDETGWVWFERRAHGSGDIEATVHLAVDGSAQSVDVLLLLLDPGLF